MPTILLKIKKTFLKGLLSSQRLPLYPGKQSHTASPSTSWHSPPFKQKFGVHGFTYPKNHVEHYIYFVQSSPF